MDWVNRLYGSYDVFEFQQEDDSSPLLLGLFLVNTMKKIHWPFFFRNSWWQPINTLQLFFSPSKHFWKRLLVRMDLLLSLFCFIIFFPWIHAILLLSHQLYTFSGIPCSTAVTTIFPQLSPRLIICLMAWIFLEGSLEDSLMVELSQIL